MVTVGNGKVDIFLQMLSSNRHFRFSSPTNEFCIKLGDKITVDSSRFLIGGNAANVAVGIARMGFKTAIVAELGSDEFSDIVTNALKKENVSDKFIKREEKDSSFSVIINYRKDRTIFEEHAERTHDFSFENVKTSWIYLTSMGNRWEDAYKKTLDYISENNIKLAFNPGTLQLAKGAESFKNVLEKTEILFINKEEGMKIAQLVFEKASGDDEYRVQTETILKEVRKIGPKTVVLTDGDRGAFLIDENGQMSAVSSQEEIQIVERTGAGDAFASGFLSAVLLGKDFNEAMRWGGENARSVIGQIGSTPGLLTRQEIEKILQ